MMVPSFAPGRLSGLGSLRGLQFATSRTGGTLYPGDTWTVTITGAGKNQTVYGDGGKNLAGCAGGYGCTQTYGTTDGAGTFTMTKTVSAGDAGVWGIAFAVGNQQAGSISFTASAQQAPEPKTEGLDPLPGTTHTDPMQVSSLPSSPLIWIGAGLAALYLLRGRGGAA